MAHLNPKKISPKKISVVIIVLGLIWFGSGLIFGTSYEEEKEAGTPSGADIGKLLKIEEMDAKPYTRLVSINGNTEANRMVELKPEVEGKVVELPIAKGSMVKPGDVIVRLDDRDRKEKLAEAQAQLAARTIEYEASKTLEAKGYRPRMGLADAKANLEKTRVAVAQTQLDYNNTRVRAPFAGRLEELNVEIGDFVLSGFFGSMDGKVMARVVEDDPILVSGRISEKDLPNVNKDAEIQVVLSDGRKLNGRIKFLSQYADTESRSFPVEVLVDNPNHDIPIGMTATINLPASSGPAYQVSSSVLALDDAGMTGVKIVDANGVVQFAYVTVLASGDDGVWINGLPEHVRLVTQGQAFVNAGQKVPQ